MAQAAESSTTTRRSFLTAAAATFPAVAVPAFAFPEPAAPSIAALGKQVIAAYETLCATDVAVTEAEAQAKAWVDANPSPELGDVDGGNVAKIKAAYADFHERQTAWVYARTAAWRAANLAGTKRAVRQAEAHHGAACDAVASFDAKTLPDLIAKARLIHYDDEIHTIAASIAYDLIEIGNEGA